MKEPGDMFAEASAIIDNLPVLHAIAAELEASRLCMEELGMTLCLDPNLVQAHLPALQKLEELGQRQFCLAQVLRAADMRTAIADIPLDALRDRMAEYMQGRQSG